MLSQEQAQQAVALLRECLDWVGLVELTTEEEERCEALSERIEALLVACGQLRAAGPGATDPVRARYEALLNWRDWLRDTAEERQAARLALDQALRQQESTAAVAAVRRYNYAYAQWEEADRGVRAAEAAYLAALAAREGGQRWSA